MTDPRLGIALGSGAARGWAHIGVLRALEARGIRPDCYAGASIGSLVGGAAASNQLDALERWARGLDRIDVLRLLDASFRGGFMTGGRLMSAIADQLEDCDIADLPTRFSAVATDLGTGREIWLRDGLLLAAIRASCGLPGLFAPVRHKHRWLVDGGLVNPVPVSLCHAMGSDLVIAVNLNADLVQSGPPDARPERLMQSRTHNKEDTSYVDQLTEKIRWLLDRSDDSPDQEPALLDVMRASIRIMQERITRSRLAGDPPTVEIVPRLPDIELMDFHMATHAMDAGRRAVDRVSGQLDELSARLESRAS